MSQPPPWNPPAPEKFPFSAIKVSNREQEFEITEATTKRVGLILGIFLLILLISLGIHLWRVDWKDKQYRYEEEFGDEKIIFQPKKPPRQGDNNIKGVSFNRNNNGMYYHEPSEMTLLKCEPPPYGNHAGNDDDDDDDLRYFDGEEPTSEAETKPMDDSEDDADHLYVSPLNPIHSHELDWDRASDTADILSGGSGQDGYAAETESMDDLDDISGDYYSDQSIPTYPVSHPATRVPLTSVSEGSLSGDLENREIPDAVSHRNAETSENHANEATENAEPEKPAVSKIKPKRATFPGSQPAPVFLGGSQRAFANPISYLGGPRINHPSSTTNSTESVLSLD